MGCCQGCARWLIGIVSICVIVCAVVAAVIVYKKEKDRDWAELVKNNIPFIFILVAMACAVFSSIIGFLLCCCKSRCLYITYLIIIVLVIAVEAIAIALAFCYTNKIIDGIDENWNNDKFEKTRVSIEKEYHCCGFKTPDIPPSKCGYDKPLGAPLCYNQIKSQIDRNMKDLKIAAIVMGAVELVLFICAVYLVCSVGKDE